MSVRNSARDEEIRRRAYLIYLERGQQPGRELDDWLQAERELKRGMLECGSATADIDTLRLLNCHDLGDC
jgi:transposase